MIDGCSRLMLRKVIAPWRCPLIGAGIYCFNLADGVHVCFDLHFVGYCEDSAGRHYGHQDGRRVSMGATHGGGVMTAIPVVVLFIMLQRYFISGLTAAV